MIYPDSSVPDGTHFASEEPFIDPDPQPIRPKASLLRKSIGPQKSYGMAVTDQPCVHCGGTGTNPKTQRLCSGCDGLGTAGGEGRHRVPVPQEVHRIPESRNHLL